jgi:hypothetical protein
MMKDEVHGVSGLRVGSEASEKDEGHRHFYKTVRVQALEAHKEIFDAGEEDLLIIPPVVKFNEDI